MALTILLVIGLFTAPDLTIGLMAIAFLMGFLPSTRWNRRSLGIKALNGGCLLAIVVVAIFAWLLYHTLTSANGGSSALARPDDRHR